MFQRTDVRTCRRQIQRIDGQEEAGDRLNWKDGTVHNYKSWVSSLSILRMRERKVNRKNLDTLESQKEKEKCDRSDENETKSRETRDKDEERGGYFVCTPCILFFAAGHV